MSGFCDIHAHVLPGIDDGPSDREGAMAMLRAAAACGIGTLAATPHIRSDFPDVAVRDLAGHCLSLREQMAGEQLDLELVSGAEVALSWALEADDEEIRLATFGQNGTDVLIETPVSVAGLDTPLYELRARGVRVTLAHPERSREFQDNDAPLVALFEQGILLQINADTLLGDPKRSGTSRLGRRLCEEGLVHALASDGHRAQSWRPITRLSEAVQAAAELVGPERAHWMAADAPAAIIAGRELPEAPPIVARRPRGFRWAWR